MKLKGLANSVNEVYCEELLAG